MELITRAKKIAKAIILPPIQALARLRRRKTLAGSLQHVDHNILINHLDAMDLPAGAVLFVHSSLKSLGFVEGGPAAVVDALIEVVVRRHGGTLAFPTFSIDGTMQATLASGRPFDVRSTPSNLGAIPECFRRLEGVRRSIHPTHSIAALGEKADWIVRDHHLGQSNFGPESPMARIMEAGGKLCGLGTTLGTVTFYHCLEDIEPDFPHRVYVPDTSYRVPCFDWTGQPCELELPAHDTEQSLTRIDRPQNEAIRSFMTERLERGAGLTWFDIGQGSGWVVDMREMYAECLRLMRGGITIYSTAEEIASYTAGHPDPV